MAISHSASSLWSQCKQFRWRDPATNALLRPRRIETVTCASKSAARVLQEAASVPASNGAKLLVRRSRSLSRAAQMEVLEELLQRGQCELALPMYEAFQAGARYRWDAPLHARVVALVTKTLRDYPLSPQAPLSPKQSAELECALIESFILQDLEPQAHEAFHRLCALLPLPKARALGYRAMLRAYAAAEKPLQAEKMLMELPSRSLDDYKAILLGFGKLGMVTEMERVAASMKQQLDTAGFNIMISSYCAAGMTDRMVHTLETMDVAGVRASLVTWNALTKACTTLVAVALQGAGALAAPQILRNRLQSEGASSGELNIVEVLLERGLPPECASYSSNVWQLDLHSMSVGTASVVLPLWLSSVRDRVDWGVLSEEVRLVSGWGKHSKFDVKAKAPVRRMIMAELEALESPFKVDSENRGAFVTRGASFNKWLSSLPR